MHIFFVYSAYISCYGLLSTVFNNQSLFSFVIYNFV